MTQTNAAPAGPRSHPEPPPTPQLSFRQILHEATISVDGRACDEPLVRAAAVLLLAHELESASPADLEPVCGYDLHYLEEISRQLLAGQIWVAGMMTAGAMTEWEACGDHAVLLHAMVATGMLSRKPSTSGWRYEPVESHPLVQAAMTIGDGAKGACA